jgi:hypothetical protein
MIQEIDLHHINSRTNNCIPDGQQSLQSTCSVAEGRYKTRLLKRKRFGFDGQKSKRNRRAEIFMSGPLLAPARDERLCKECKTIDFNAISNASRANLGKFLPVQAEI